MIRYSIHPTRKFDIQFKKGFMSEFMMKLDVKIAARIAQLRKSIGNFLAETFSKTDVVQSLIGQEPEDLGAHLGLSHTIALGLVEGMENIIRNSVTIVVNRDKYKVQIRAIERDFAEFRSLPGAQYVSKPSLMLIPVVDWMLINPDIDVGQAAYDIVFRGVEPDLDERIYQVSRSGRAIMVSLKEFGGGGGYVLPSILHKKAGKNFIEYAIMQEGVATQVAQMVIERIQ